MKIIEQSVKILSPRTPQEGIDELRLVEFACRNCYRSQDKMTDVSYDNFIRKVNLGRGHEAPLEFGHMAVEIVTSRDVLAEITRHRVASFCVQSQRYVMDNKEGEISFIQPDFYIPDNPNTDAKTWCASRDWERSMRDAENHYKYQIESCGMKPEDARKVLPNSTACVIIMSANLREWRYIMKLRTSKAAYPEMRTVMNMLVDEAQKVIPVIFENVREEDQ